MTFSFVLERAGPLISLLLIAVMSQPASQVQAVSAPISAIALDDFDEESNHGDGEIGTLIDLAGTGEPPTAPFLDSSGQSVNTPVNLLDGAYGVAVSPDGRHLYASAFLDDFVLLYERNQLSGFLTYSAGFSNLSMDGPQLVAVSPDGEQVYVASGISGTLTVLERDLTTGFLSVGEVFDPTDVFDLQGAYGVAVSPNGRFIYVTSLLQGAVIGFERLTDDSLVFRALNSDLSNPDLIQARNLTVSPDGLHLYVTAENAATASSGNIVVYQIDPATGAISAAQLIFEGMFIRLVPFPIQLDAIGGAFDAVVSPNGENVYVVGTYDDTVAVFDRNAATGELTYRMRMRDGDGGVDGLDGASGVEITPDGRYVVSTAYNDDAVAVFGRDPSDGFLSQVQVISRGLIPPFRPLLSGARDVVISEEGSSVYVGAFLDDAIVGFQALSIFTDGFESGDTSAWSTSVP